MYYITLYYGISSYVVSYLIYNIKEMESVREKLKWAMKEVVKVDKENLYLCVYLYLYLIPVPIAYTYSL